MTYINVKGRDRFLYRAVDSTGQTIDFLLTDRRDAAAGQAKFIGTLLWDRRLIAMEPAAALANLNVFATQPEKVMKKSAIRVFSLASP